MLNGHTLKFHKSSNNCCTDLTGNINEFSRVNWMCTFTGDVVKNCSYLMNTFQQKHNIHRFKIGNFTIFLATLVKTLPI